MTVPGTDNGNFMSVRKDVEDEYKRQLNMINGVATRPADIVTGINQNSPYGMVLASLGGGGMDSIRYIPAGMSIMSITPITGITAPMGVSWPMIEPVAQKEESFMPSEEEITVGKGSLGFTWDPE